MKKYLFFSAPILLITFNLSAQPDKTKYPDPEFSNEICYLKKDSINTTVRLEKGSSKMNTKVKMGGYGGTESGYEMEDERSTVRLNSGANLCFIFFTGTSSQSATAIAKKDSMMRANGMDPAMLQEMTDPSNTISLYKAESAKDKRKILLQKSPGANPFASKKTQSSSKFTLSVKKIREGYWELIVDKALPKGEYIFIMMNRNLNNMDGSMTLFAFAVD